MRGEGRGSNPTDHIVHEKWRDLRLRWNGLVESSSIKSFLFPIFKIRFLKNSLPSAF